MWLWDSNIVRHFGDQHPNLVAHLQQIPWSEIALPSVVVAEILLHGRCEFALKATPFQIPLAHQRLWQTQQFLSQFNVIMFDIVIFIYFCTLYPFLVGWIRFA